MKKKILLASMVFIAALLMISPVSAAVIPIQTIPGKLYFYNTLTGVYYGADDNNRPITGKPLEETDMLTETKLARSELNAKTYEAVADNQKNLLHTKYLRFAAAGQVIAQYIKLIQPSPGAFAIESTIERFVEGKKDVSSYDANPETFGTLAFLWDNFPLSHVEELYCKSKASSYFIRDVAGSLSTRGTLPSRGSILFATGRRTECNLPSGCDGNKFVLPSGASYLYKLSWYVANPSSKSDHGKKAGVREDGSIVFSVRLYEGNTQKGTLGQFKIGPGGFSSQTEVKYSSRFYNKVCIVFDEGYAYDGTHTEWPANCPTLVEEKPKTPGFIQQQLTAAPPGNAPPSAPPTGGETLQDPNW